MVDLTKMVSVVHQNHDYSHHPEGWTGCDERKRSEAEHWHFLVELHIAFWMLHMIV